MFSVKKIKDRGFTIVELLIVIVVIGILATLVITTYNGIQEKARDTKRKTDLNALQGQIEAYEAQNGNYPCLASVTSACTADINSTSFRSTNMKGLDPSALQDPKGSSEALVGTPATNVYSYEATPGGCDDATAGGDCTGYTLTANLEGDPTHPDVKKNLN